MRKEDSTELLSIDGTEVRITNPDKPYFSQQAKLSKLDLVRYYLSVAAGALDITSTAAAIKPTHPSLALSWRFILVPPACITFWGEGVKCY